MEKLPSWKRRCVKAVAVAEIPPLHPGRQGWPSFTLATGTVWSQGVVPGDESKLRTSRARMQNPKPKLC